MKRLLHLFRRRADGRHLADEMREHVREITDELIAGGMAAHEARAEARRRFGNATAMEERIYIASVYAPRALRTLARLAQMSGFVQPTPESFNPPKLRIDMMMSTMAAAY